MSRASRRLPRFSAPLHLDIPVDGRMPRSWLQCCSRERRLFSNVQLHPAAPAKPRGDLVYCVPPSAEDPIGRKNQHATPLGKYKVDGCESVHGEPGRVPRSEQLPRRFIRAASGMTFSPAQPNCAEGFEARGSQGMMKQPRSKLGAGLAIVGAPGQPHRRERSCPRMILDHSRYSRSFSSIAVVRSSSSVVGQFHHGSVGLPI
jgi:hypothetical protein